MPYELSRRNFKNAQRVIEHSSSALTTSLAATTKAASKNAAPEATLESLDTMITKMQSLKRKLENLHEEETRIHRSAKARLQHLQDLYQVHSLVDVKYDEWSRTRLSRLLVDYLLREGYADSAACLAESKGITDLVDVDAFVACHRIERSLREKMSTTLALEWCKEHGKELKKMGSLLEFELRLQQYIELVRQGHEAGLSGMDGLETEGVSIGGGGGGEAKLVESRAHAKKYLSSSGDFELTRRAAGMLAYRPWEEVEPYAVSHHDEYVGRHSLTICLLFLVPILARQMVPPRRHLPLNTPHPLLPASPTTPPHRPQRRPLRPQDARLPLRIHSLRHKCLLVCHHRVSHLQRRTQGTRPQRPLCPAHKEYSGRWPCCPAQWPGVWL